MSPKIACIVCGMYGTKDDFTPKSNNTCKKCSRIRHLEQRLDFLESEMKSSESLQIRVSALEKINRQKNDGDLLERGSSHTDLEDGAQGKVERLPEQLKEQEPVEESAEMAVGGKVSKEIAPGPLKKADLEKKINDVIEAKQYFIIGVAKRDGSAKESMEKYEKRSPHLDEKYINTIRDYKVNFVKVFYGYILTAVKACDLESQRLLGIFRKDTCEHCLNAKSGEDEWLREKDAEEGIVFLHVYSV